MKLTLYYLAISIAIILTILSAWLILDIASNRHITQFSLPEEYKLIEVGDTVYLNQSSNGDYTLGFSSISKFDTQVIITP